MASRSMLMLLSWTGSAASEAISLHSVYSNDTTRYSAGNEFTSAITHMQASASEERAKYAQMTVNEKMAGMAQTPLALTAVNLPNIQPTSNKSMPWGLKDVSAENYNFIAANMGADDMTQHAAGKTCAVVGNGGSLKDSGAGALIDAHDIVIRCNNPPRTDEFSGDIGNKTTHFAVKATTGPELAIQIFQPVPGSATNEMVDWHLMWFVEETCSDNCHPKGNGEEGFAALRGATTPTNSRNIHLANPEFEDYLWSIWMAEHNENSIQPSTGINALMFALAMKCSTIDVYGYGPSSCQYYYDCSKTGSDYQTQEYHDFYLEAKLRQSLADAGLVALHPAAMVMSDAEFNAQFKDAAKADASREHKEEKTDQQQQHHSLHAAETTEKHSLQA